MPLTKSGKKVLASMVKQYGAKKVKEIFYASINKGKKGSKKWHGKRKYPLGGKTGGILWVTAGKKKREAPLGRGGAGIASKIRMSAQPQQARGGGLARGQARGGGLARGQARGLAEGGIFKQQKIKRYIPK